MRKEGNVGTSGFRAGMQGTRRTWEKQRTVVVAMALGTLQTHSLMDTILSDRSDQRHILLTHYPPPPKALDRKKDIPTMLELSETAILQLAG